MDGSAYAQRDRKRTISYTLHSLTFNDILLAHVAVHVRSQVVAKAQDREFRESHPGSAAAKGQPSIHGPKPRFACH